MPDESTSPEPSAGEEPKKQETVKEIHHHHYRKRGWFFGLITFLLSVALFFIAIILIVYFSSGGNFPWQQIELSGETIQEARIVSDFNSIELLGSGNIYIEQTGEESLTIEADKNLLEKIDTEVKGSKLEISFEAPLFWWPFSNTSEINYYLTVDDLEAVSITGSGKVVSESLTADSFKMTVTGSGDADLNLNVSKLESIISGSGKYTFTGQANEQKLVITGSGKYLAKELVSQTVDVVITGSGKAEVNVSQSLDVKISGSGDVYYVGEPVDLITNISGSGKIEKLTDSNGVAKPATDFFDCVEAGNTVMESYPRQCRTEDGQNFTEDIGNEMDKIDLIRLDSPRPNQEISSPLALTGEARGTWFFEGDFPVILKDNEGNEIATGIASAKGEWMTAEFVQFQAVLMFDSSELERGDLILQKDNPSGLPEHEDSLRVPVLFN